LPKEKIVRFRIENRQFQHPETNEFPDGNYSAQFALVRQKAGLSRFGSAGYLTELGIVHQGVAHRGKAMSCLYCATP
jgi:hypothetical protein